MPLDVNKIIFESLNEVESLTETKAAEAIAEKRLRKVTQDAHTSNDELINRESKLHAKSIDARNDLARKHFDGSITSQADSDKAVKDYAKKVKDIDTEHEKLEIDKGVELGKHGSKYLKASSDVGRGGNWSDELEAHSGGKLTLNPDDIDLPKTGAVAAAIAAGLGALALRKRMKKASKK